MATHLTLEEKLKVIDNNYTKAVSYYENYKGLGSDNELVELINNSDVNFFGIAHIALKEMGIVVLYRLFDKSDNTISIPNILKTITQNDLKDICDEKGNIIFNLRDLIHKSDSFKKQIGTFRNKYLAHSDIKLSANKIEVTPNDIEKALEFVVFFRNAFKINANIIFGGMLTSEYNIDFNKLKSILIGKSDDTQPLTH